MGRHEQRKAERMRDPLFRKAYEEAEAELFVSQHPEFEGWDRGRMPSGESEENLPMPPESKGGRKVLTGYEQLARDKAVPVPPDGSRTLAQRRLAVKLEKAMALLPRKRQELLRRIYWEKQTQQEVAADLGISQQAVAQRLNTARRQLKKVYRDDIEVQEEEL